MSAIWELDFYSRPILDQDQKKVWEVLICQSPTSIDQSLDSLFKYAQYCSNQTVNSIWLGEAIEQAISQAGETPQKIRFFRRQMNNMIVKACEDMGIAAAASRRTYSLAAWIEQRMKTVYPQAEGYQASAAAIASVQYPATTAVPLPDAIRGDRGDRWAMVGLSAADFQAMNQWDIGFGEAFPLDLVDISPDTPIPGLLIYSPRAIAFAAWMSGLEIDWLEFEGGSRPRICLETGISDSWILANITNAQTLAEAKKFESQKQAARGVHFLAIQSDPQSESFAGFWLLLDRGSR